MFDFMSDRDLVIAFTILLSASVVWLVFLLLAGQRSDMRLHRRRLAEEKKGELLKRQRNVGDRIWDSMVSPCRANRSSDIFPERARENGDLGYSIVVGLGGDSSFTLGGLKYRGHAVVSIDIDMSKEPKEPAITVVYHDSLGDIGRREICGSSNEVELKELIMRVSRYVINYSPLPSRASFVEN